MGPSGALTLNLLAIDKIFDYFDIDKEDRLELYPMIQQIAAASIKAVNDEAERQRKIAEKKR